MSYAVHVKQVPPQVVVTQRLHTPLARIGDVMHATLAKVARSVQPVTAARGVPFAVYYNEPFRPDDVDVELGLPIASDAEVSEAIGVHRRELPGGPVAYTTHVGPYGTIGAAYEALFEWIRVHGHERVGPPREIYIVGPGQGAKPEELRTEIEVPID